MNLSTAVFLINNNVRAVLVAYEANPSAKRELYKTLDQTLKVGDFVVVPTDTRHGMTVSKVVEVDVDVDFDATTPVKWIVQKVDRSDYERTVTEESIAVKAIQSAETNRKRKQLAEAMFANDAATIKALPMSSMGDTAGDTSK